MSGSERRSFSAESLAAEIAGARMSAVANTASRTKNTHLVLQAAGQALDDRGRVTPCSASAPGRPLTRLITWLHTTRSLRTLGLVPGLAPGRPLAGMEAGMSVTIRVLAPVVTGEQRCHFLVQWRDSHAIQHGRTFTTFDEAAVFDAAIKAGGCREMRQAAGRR